MKMSFLSLCCLFLLWSCDEAETPSIEPENLQLVLNISSDGTGEVGIQATADNTIEYHFYMGDGNVNEPFISTDGFYEHTYNVLGVYQVEVRAYGASGRYVKKTKQISVDAGAPVSTGEGYTTPTSYPGMELAWTDEFEGTSLNENDWCYEIGTGCPNLCGWGNNELEYYRKENTRVEGGTLIIEARKEDFDGSSYTSSRIITRGKQFFKYGRIDIRAKLPKGQGLWPALWMLGINQPVVGWPKCGEIDIMEMVGGSGRENQVIGNVFWDDNGTRDFPSKYTISEGTLSDKFHVFTLLWDEQTIKWLIDDVEFHSFSTSPSTRAEFQEEFFFIFNIAVGGTLPGSPDATTIFPTDMRVDYVRMFQPK